VDWSREREWVKAVAMDSDGKWFRYDKFPEIGKYDAWWADGCKHQSMHRSEYPQFTGDWKDSLCIRPT
jgi:hypothetical protein